MKNTLKKSLTLLTLAAFMMVFASCSKDSSSNNNNGGGITPPITGNYGTIVLGNQSYTIRIAGYEVYYDEDIQANVTSIVLADGIVSSTQNPNIFGISIPNCNELTAGNYNYTTQEPAPQGMCRGIFTASNHNVLYCTAGSVTITAHGTNYKIESEGVASALNGPMSMDFTVDFNGPIANETK